jgi:lysophospholipase L1-like esterase
MRRPVYLLAVVLVVALAAGLAGATAASAAKGNVLVLSRENNGAEGNDAASVLTSLGYTATVTSTLPANLSPYSSVWSILAYQGLSSEEQEALEKYVKGGGKLYLTGERPCCEELDLSDQAILRSVLTNQSIVVGQQGDLSGPFTFNPNAEDGIAVDPNKLTEFPVDAPGGVVGIGGVDEPNVLASNGEMAVGGVFDEGDMKNGKGRIVLYMDIDWLAQASSSTRLHVIENIQDFLEKTPNHKFSLSPEYVALGDSYASGLGSFSYLTNSKGKASPCFRAKEGYAEQISADEGETLGFAACAGSTISNIVLGKKAQIDEVGPNTHLITLSIGGNDIGFSHVLDDCIGGVGAKGGTGCAQRDETATQEAFVWLEIGREPGTYTLPGIESARDTKHPKVTNSTFLPSLAELYEQIVHAAAPGAQLLVVGYPELFETAIDPVERCQVGTVLGLDKLNVAASDVEWLDERAAQLDGIISDSVETAVANTGANITFVDPRSAFYGGVVCDEHAQEDINALLFKSFSWNVEEESFHPTQTGQNALAQEILDEIGGGGGIIATSVGAHGGGGGTTR